LAWWAISLSLVIVGVVQAAGPVEVLDTYPAGETVALNRNQNFYLHLRYSSDHPIVIWARPYFHGEPINAGSNGSFTYTGSGEALSWFFLLSKDAQVDEIRIAAGDGSPHGTPVVASYPIRLTLSDTQSVVTPEPEWLPRLKARDAARTRQAYEEQTHKPVSAIDSLAVSILGCGMLAIAAFGFVMPLRALWRWRGGWRVAAIIPAALMVLVVLRLIIGTTIDPTSHNLWPFEIMIVGGLSALMMGALTLLRKHSMGAGPP